MSPKIWTLIAGTSLGLLVSASACTVTSSDDGGDNDDGGASAGVGGNGTGGSTTTSTGGTGGTGVGGGGTCVGCNDYLYPSAEGMVPCGFNPADQSCDLDSSCEIAADLLNCVCVDDSTGAPACATECGGGEGICDGFGPPTTECEECITSSLCNGAYNACTGDI